MRINMEEAKIIYPELSYETVGILYAAHNELGRYCNEKQYCDLIEQKFKEHRICYEREKVLEQYFPAEKSGRHRIDFLVEDKIILEIKCRRVLEREDYYQTRRYLDALDKKLAIMVNFRERFLKPRRILNSHNKNY